MASFLTYSLITPIYILVKDHNIFVKYISPKQRSTLLLLLQVISSVINILESLSLLERLLLFSLAGILWFVLRLPSSSCGVMLSLLVSADRFACRHKTAGPPEDGVVRVLGVAAAPYQKSDILSASTIRATSPQNSCEK